MGKSTKKQKTSVKLREFSSGGVVHRGDRWLVTRSTPSEHFPSFWRLPKGWIDNETFDTPGPVARGDRRATQDELEATAVREVKEEGGVEAKIVKKIGTTNFTYNATRGRTLKFVTFYLMEWVRDLPEGTDAETDEIAWLPFEEAHERLTFQGEKDILQKAKELI